MTAWFYDTLLNTSNIFVRFSFSGQIRNYLQFFLSYSVKEDAWLDAGGLFGLIKSRQLEKYKLSLHNLC